MEAKVNINPNPKELDQQDGIGQTTNYNTHNKDLYNYTAGVLCGVLVERSIMLKLAKLQAKHLEQVKRLLAEGADDGKVYPSMWTLHYPSGVQTNVHFIDTSVNVSDRIKTATTASRPKHHPLVFVASSMDEAKSMADARFKAIGESDE